MSVRVKKNYLTFEDKQFKCSIGRSGFSKDKREGDGSTPVGSFNIENIYVFAGIPSIVEAMMREFIKSIKNFAPSFGGINLEYIAAPDCFIIEQTLKEILNIPVFHDDQHGTATVSYTHLRAHET